MNCPECGTNVPEDHKLCHANAERQREDYRAARLQLLREIDANAVIGSRLRSMVLPGVKRKVYRREEIEALIADVDALAAARDARRQP